MPSISGSGVAEHVFYSFLFCSSCFVIQSWARIYTLERNACSSNISCPFQHSLFRSNVLILHINMIFYTFHLVLYHLLLKIWTTNLFANLSCRFPFLLSLIVSVLLIFYHCFYPVFALKRIWAWFRKTEILIYLFCWLKSYQVVKSNNRHTTQAYVFFPDYELNGIAYACHA